MSDIATKLTYLNETKSQLKDMINYGLPTENQITNETTFRNYVKGIFEAFIESLRDSTTLYTNLPKKSGNGTQITLNDTANAPMRITLGSSALEQTTYTGKNLLNTSNLSEQTINGITFTPVYNNGLLKYVNANGTATNTCWYIITSSFSYEVDNYFFNANSTNSNLRLYSDISGYVTTTKIVNNKTAISRNVTINVPNGTTLSNAKIYPMIAKSNTATEYEPYVGGTTSPNPEYPQDIHTISGDNSVVVEGKNLISKANYYSKTNKYSSLVNVNYNVVNGEYYAISVDIPNNPSIEMYINLNTETLLTRISGTYNTSLDGTRKTWVVRANATGSPTNVSLFARYSDTSTTATGLLSNIMIEHIASASGTSTSYEPYVSQTAPINLPVENKFNIATITENTYINLYGNTGTSSVSNLSDYIEVNSSTQYTLSYTYSSLLNQDVRNIVYYTSNKTVAGGITYSPLNKTNQFTTLNDTKFIRFSYDKNINNIQLEQGTKANSYTPYGTTPIEYCKIGDYEDKFILTSGKNLLNPNVATSNCSVDTTTGIITITANSTDTYIKGAYVYTDANKFLTLPSGSYYIKSTNSKVRITLYSDGSALDTANNQPITLSSETNFGGLRIRSTDSSSLQNVSFGIMISTTDTPYEPYGTNQWYLKKNIGKVVLDGSESWDNFQIESSGLGRAIVSSSNVYYESNQNTIMASNMVGVRYSGSWNNTYDCIASYASNRFIAYLENASDLATFKSILNNSNAIVYYVLNTPTYTQITGTLETQLNNIYEKLLSYKGTTNISQVNNDLPFVLGVSAIQDLE